MNNARVFIDTSYFAAFANKRDPFHEKAKAFLPKCFERGYSLYTTDHVFSETITLLRCKMKVSVQDIFKIIQNIELSNIRLFGVDQDLFKDALELMGKYDDHYFSMTDCISFVVMRELKTRNVLTLDRDFEAAGYNNLLFAD